MHLALHGPAAPAPESSAGNKGSGQQLSQVPTARRPPTFHGPVSWKHLVREFTTLMPAVQEPHKTLDAKGTKSVHADDFQEVNKNLPPPICLVASNSDLGSGKGWTRIAKGSRTEEWAQFLGRYWPLFIQQTKFPETHSLRFFFS